MSLPVQLSWFSRSRIDDATRLLVEPYVDPLIRCNIWHLRGRNRDLLVDSGLGIVSLRSAAADLFDRPVVAVATHSHYDHRGGLAEFDVRVAHPAEADLLSAPEQGPLRRVDFPPSLLAAIEPAYRLDELLVTALPHDGFALEGFTQPAASPTWLVDEGDVIDLGDRAFEVLHVPGHSPGSIALWEQGTGMLFSGDLIYDGPLLDETPDAVVEDYVRSLQRLRKLPVSVVHAGHGPSFGRDRLLELIDAYLLRRDG